MNISLSASYTAPRRRYRFLHRLRIGTFDHRHDGAVSAKEMAQFSPLSDEFRAAHQLEFYGMGRWKEEGDTR